MSKEKQSLWANICFSCIAGVYSGIIIFSIVTSLFFHSYFKGKELLGGYGLAIVIGAIIGVIIAYLFSKHKG